MSTGSSDYFDGQASRDGEVDDLRSKLNDLADRCLQRDRRITELEAALQLAAEWTVNPLLVDAKIADQHREAMATIRAALRSALASSAPETQEETCQTCDKRRGFSSFCSSSFHCCRDCVWKEGVCIEACWRCEKLDGYVKAEWAARDNECCIDIDGEHEVECEQTAIEQVIQAVRDTHPEHIDDCIYCGPLRRALTTLDAARKYKKDSNE